MNGKVVLVNPSPGYDREEYKRYDISLGTGAPFGLLLLATVLEKNGFRTRIIDGQVCDCNAELERELVKNDVSCVGVSVMSSQYKHAAELSMLAKRLRNGIPVVWGGFHPTILPEKTISNTFIDYIIRGEGDKAFLKLCRMLGGSGRIEDVGNAVYRRDGKIVRNELEQLSSFEELPRLNWDLLDDAEKYVRKVNPLGEKTRSINILAGLGCNFQCTFCHNAIFMKRHRIRNAGDMIEEMRSLGKKYNIVEFGLVDENFFGDKGRIEDFLQFLEKDDHHFKWSSTLRANYVTSGYLNEPMLKRIYAAGGYYFGVGAESGNEFVLKKLKKGIKPENVINLATWTRNAGIAVTYSFIVGIPGETCQMTLDTLRFIRKIKKINPGSLIIGPQVFRPYPGSPLYQEALQNGLKEPEDWNNAGEFFESLSHFTRIDAGSIPWHKEPEKFKYMMLSFYALQIEKTRNPVLNTGLQLLKVLSRIRLATGLYGCFIEGAALDLLNTRLK